MPLPQRLQRFVSAAAISLAIAGPAAGRASSPSSSGCNRSAPSSITLAAAETSSLLQLRRRPCEAGARQALELVGHHGIPAEPGLAGDLTFGWPGWRRSLPERAGAGLPSFQPVVKTRTWSGSRTPPANATLPAENVVRCTPMEMSVRGDSWRARPDRLTNSTSRSPGSSLKPRRPSRTAVPVVVAGPEGIPVEPIADLVPPSSIAQLPVTDRQACSTNHCRLGIPQRPLLGARPIPVSGSRRVDHCRRRT